MKNTILQNILCSLINVNCTIESANKKVLPFSFLSCGKTYLLWSNVLEENLFTTSNIRCYISQYTSMHT